MPKTESTTRTDSAVRKHVIDLLSSGHAHATFADAVKGLAPEMRGRSPAGSPHSVWELVEHIRLAQDDIVHFSRNTDGSYKELPWPEAYWPSSPAPDSDRAWNESLRAVEEGRRAMEALVADESLDLYAPFPWGDGQTLLRQALLLADHNSYHVGEIVLVRRMLGAWGN